MTDTQTQRCMLVLHVPPTLEDSLIDWLLETEEAGSFTSIACNGHGAGTQQLSLAEQVTGRSRRVQFEVVIDSADLAVLLHKAKKRFAGANIYYRVVPVYLDGHL